MLIILLALCFTVMAACVLWAVATWFSLHYDIRRKTTIVRGLHQQDEDLAFPTEFAQQVSDVHGED